jgi:hypothetical protein
LNFELQIVGVDFSGAARAGRKIWLALGVVAGATLRIDRLVRAADLPGGGAERGPAVAALRTWIAGCGEAVIGLDLPLALPLALMGGGGWDAWVRAFADRYPSADAFRTACRQAAGGREVRRRADIEARVPFAAYNLRLYRQTFYGLRDLVAPLACDGCAAVLPMQAPLAGRPRIIEICPASTLKRLGLYRPYKGRGAAQRAARDSLLAALERDAPLRIPPAAREAALADGEGDALDSLVAALAVFRNLHAPGGFAPRDPLEQQEGRVYV